MEKEGGMKKKVRQEKERIQHSFKMNMNCVFSHYDGLPKAACSTMLS
jgi:hypothetical protein